MKTREDNEVTDRTGTVYVKNDIELSWLIRPDVGSDEN